MHRIRKIIFVGGKDAKGITLPAEALTELNVDVGDYISLESFKDRIIIKKVKI